MNANSDLKQIRSSSLSEAIEPEDSCNSFSQESNSEVKQEQKISPDNKSSDDFAKKKQKKKYSVITQQVREQFIKRVLSKEATIKQVIFNSMFRNADHECIANI
mgnify:CR=1 FL=1